MCPSCLVALVLRCRSCLASCDVCFCRLMCQLAPSWLLLLHFASGIVILPCPLTEVGPLNRSQGHPRRGIIRLHLVPQIFKLQTLAFENESVITIIDVWKNQKMGMCMCGHVFLGVGVNASKCIRMCTGAPACAGAFVCRGQHSTTGTVPQELSTLTLEMRSSHWDSTVG